MAPEHEARPRADFYDHESEEPRRRRRAAVDWGVGEDIFDRMPSRRFSRTERRAEHHEIVIRRGDGEPRGDEDAWGDEPRGRVGAPRRDEDAWGDEPRGRVAGARRDAASWGDEDAWEQGRSVDVGEPAWEDQDIQAAEPGGGPNGRPSVDSWMDERRLVPGESRTIVLGADGAPEPGRDAEVAPEVPRERRTVKISGHPDRLPVPRTQRPPRTAVERIGASPDRIVAYAVALGFLLVLIAVLTTGQ